MNRLISRRPFALAPAAVGVLFVLPALIPFSPARGDGGPATEPRWSLVVTTAPHAPQDVWFTATGNNTDGWNGGGCLCLGGLAQGLGPGDHATILIDVIEGGVFGVDGTPVPPGTYIAPGATVIRDVTGPGAELEDREFDMTPGRTFYVIVNAYIVESNIPELPPAGTMLTSMFTWDFDPDDLGRTENLAVNWFDIPGLGFIPFLNEGVLMTNVRRLQ
jgi:hypothetical protein